MWLQLLVAKKWTTFFIVAIGVNWWIEYLLIWSCHFSPILCTSVNSKDFYPLLKPISSAKELLCNSWVSCNIHRVDSKYDYLIKSYLLTMSQTPSSPWFCCIFTVFGFADTFIKGSDSVRFRYMYVSEKHKEYQHTEGLFFFFNLSITDSSFCYHYNFLSSYTLSFYISFMERNSNSKKTCAPRSIQCK